MASVEISGNEREQVVTELGKFVRLNRCALETGDFRVKNNKGECVYLVERKTLADLRSSFSTNQHLQDQVARMQAESKLGGFRCFLVVESKTVPSWSGKPVHGPGGRRLRVTDKALMSCLTKLQLAGLPIVFVSTVAETGMFLAWLAKRADEERPDPRELTDVLGDCVPIARTARAKHATKQDVLTSMLACIPGVSKKRAQCILKKRGTFASICDRKLTVEEFTGDNIGKKTVASVNSILCEEAKPDSC